MSTSRREFLYLSGSALAAASAMGRPQEALAHGAGPMRPANLPWRASVTDATRKFAPQPAQPWSVTPSAGADAVRVEPHKRYQQIEGFGGAFTDAACWVIHQLPEAERAALLHELFHPSAMGLSVCRTCIGSSDYSRSVYSFDEGEPDPEMKRFTVDHDRDYILPVLQQARQVNPGLYLFSSPWSPPGWMKGNRSMLGGAMQRKSMPAYARYFVKFLQAYAEAGVPVQAVTVQNEVDTEQDGQMPACAWPQEYEADFVRNFLGPALKQAGIKTEIWLIDHNYNLWGRAISELETPGVRDHAHTIAWHGYVGDVAWIDRVSQAFPDVSMRWTEGGPDYTDPNYHTDWTKWSSTFTGILRHGCASITAWNLALDEQGKPNLGPFPCGGMVSVDSRTREVAYSGQYHGMAHFSRTIRRGAHRISSESDAKDLDHCAFVNSNGESVVVLTNRGKARTCDLHAGTSIARVELPENSVVTVSWDEQR